MALSRRSWLVLTIIAPGLAAFGAGRAWAADRELLDAKEMKAVLRTTEIEDQGFIDHVLKLVDHGILPKSLVWKTFLWARRKPEHKFQYFRKAMLVQASRIGVDIEHTEVDDAK